VMNKAIVGAMCLGFTAAAGAYTWELVASYPVPVPNPRGYRVYGASYGYIIDAGTTPYVYEIYLRTSSIVSSFPAPGGAGAWGIAGVTDELYISNNRTSWIYEVTAYGSVVSSFRCPIEGPADMDLRWAPSNLYIAIPDRNIIAVVNETTGSLVSTFRAPGSRPTACCGYQTTLIADAATHTVYENGVPVITGIATPVGADDNFTLDYDYWVYVLDDATDRIYMYEKTVAVVPASLGRVKAMFE
jgi:hypothetical protein